MLIETRNIKPQIKYYSFWFTRLQGILYILAFVAFGLGDSISGLWMIGERGMMYEANPFARFIIYEYGLSGLIEFKIWITIMCLLIPYIAQSRSHESHYWMINGYLVSFILAGTLATIMNYQAMLYEDIFLSPGQVIIIFLSSICLLTHIGGEIDKLVDLKMRGYFESLKHDAVFMISIIWYSDFPTSILKKKIN